MSKRLIVDERISFSVFCTPNFAFFYPDSWFVRVRVTKPLIVTGERARTAGSRDCSMRLLHGIVVQRGAAETGKRLGKENESCKYISNCRVRNDHSSISFRRTDVCS